MGLVRLGTTNAIALVRAIFSGDLGLMPSSVAIEITLLRVLSDTPGFPFSAYDTDAVEIPNLRAISEAE